MYIMIAKVKYILSILISIFIGFVLAILFLNLNIIESVDISGLTYWAPIILGALVSALLVIIATYFTVKKQEIIKLKAKVIERNIEIVYQLIQLSKVLNTMTLEDDKKKTDLEFDYDCDHIDEWPISIPSVLTEEFRASGWYVNFIMLMDVNSRIMNTEIIHYEHFIKEYFYNLHLIYDKIPISKKWQVAFVLKPDFREICGEFNILLEDYLQNEIYKMKRSKKPWDLKKEKFYRNKLKETNLFKYKKEFESLIR